VNRIASFLAIIVLLAGCGVPSLPPMKDYTLNETSFKVYEGWKEEVKEEGKLKMMLFRPELPWGSFALMRYEGMEGDKVLKNIKNAFPSMGHELLAEYNKEINGSLFSFFDFKNADKSIPLKYGILGVVSGDGFALAIQIYSDFQGLDHEENGELKALAETVKLK
jgi:hypothetical protein